MEDTKFKCDHEGCESTDTVVYDWPHDDDSENLCDEHAKAHGFCLGCQQYCAGHESYDFSSIPGYCSDCVSQIQSEWAEEYDDDDYDEYDDEEDYY